MVQLSTKQVSEISSILLNVSLNSTKQQQNNQGSNKRPHDSKNYYLNLNWHTGLKLVAHAIHPIRDPFSSHKRIQIVARYISGHFYTPQPDEIGIGLQQMMQTKP